MRKIELSKNTLKEFFLKYGVGFGIALEFVVILGIYLMLLLNVPTQNGDNVEHIHSSFLIFQGKIPYRDFFQHHNPLMWFIFAPLTGVFSYDVTISEVVGFISFLVFLKSLVYVYHLVNEFIGGKFAGVLSFLFLMVPSYKVYALDFRPDNYMVFCLMGGLFYYFRYLRDVKCGDLIVAGVFFTLSFLFAQKALFPLFLIGLSGLWFWYKKEIKTKDLVKMLLVTGIILGGFFGYLWKYNIIRVYFASNYEFNLNLVEGFELGRIAKIDNYMRMWLWFGAIGSFMGILSKDKFKVLLGIMFWAEFLQRFFYFSPYSYYYWLLSYFMVLNGIYLLKTLDDKNRLVRVAMVVIVGVNLWNIFGYQHNVYVNSKDRAYLPDYITRKISKCDYVFNGDGLMYNMFARDPHYYWQLIGQLDVVGEKTGLIKKPDMNYLIENIKPRFIYGKNYFNKFAEESGRREIVHYLDLEMIEKYYKKTEFLNIYELKDEYVKECWE
ncbi:MAG: glycosyltransferase family 39 protein [Alphaproteobacteria bacterium]|nr:glycosyltransferase family 39 protein [Alphaproteobacteria bacterium]